LALAGFRRNNPQPKYENNMRNKLSPRALVYAGCAIFALTTALAQDVELRHDSKDSKSVPITQEKEPLVHFLLETGYESEYNFRGTNLMPGAIGGYFYQIQATVPKVGPGSLTLGLWAIHQIGEASVNAWSISEGGGGGGSAFLFPIVPVPGQPPVIVPLEVFPTTTQTQFREFDLFASYRFSLGPVDVTLGNIAFIIDRQAQTRATLVIENPNFVWAQTGTPFLRVGPIPTVTGELFDRLYIRLSTNKIPHITPSIVYYQTIYNNGDQPTNPFITVNDEFGNTFTGVPGPVRERNEKLGGYLEGRINGNFPVGHWVDINPYGVIAASFRDRTEPTAAANSFAGRPFTGFTHAQAGLELAFHIGPHVDFVPQAVYSHHISNPPIGTNKNEFWAGVKVAVNLW
jgi:hypothetical protein